MTKIKTLKQHMRAMKVGELKAFWYDEQANEWWILVKKDRTNFWIIEAHIGEGSTYETLYNQYCYDEIPDRLYVTERKGDEHKWANR